MGSLPQQGRVDGLRSAGIFTILALMVSGGLFTLLQSPVVVAGCPTVPVGPSALVVGVIVAARGLKWSQKWRPIVAICITMAAIVALGSPMWFDIYRLGDMSTAPQSLNVISAVPLLFFAAFAFLPWAVPIAVLVVTVGRDPRKLWSPGGRD